jgi:hypothetical protein
VTVDLFDVRKVQGVVADQNERFTTVLEIRRIQRRPRCFVPSATEEAGENDQSTKIHHARCCNVCAEHK